ncbi:MAG: sugar phosphate isomerase/epimerase [Firmicutes bacterium]|nr:sugar phosphate isomerase/epimerase [Bacillota bacterium]
MIAVSTSWISEGTTSARAVLKALESLDAPAVELDYRIGPRTYRDLRPLLKEAGIRVVSVHNFFPTPDLAREPSGDVFLYTSDDDRERELALRYTLRTLEACAEVEARVAVLHLGHVPLRGEVDRLYELHGRGELEGPEGRAARRELTERRAQLAPRYVDRVLLALDRILRAAERLGVVVGVENRYHYHEIPAPEEIGLILREFRGAPVGYWHDTGHAHHWEVMGWARQEDFLQAYGGHLVGMHLHDARGREDHLAPGTGEVDFALVARHLRDGVLRVTEVHAKSDLEAYRSGLALLRRLGF